MATDEEKTKLEKLLQGLEVPEIKLSERCLCLVKEFHKKFDGELENENKTMEVEEIHNNPYKPNRQLLDEVERKLQDLLSESKSVNKECWGSLPVTGADLKRPWRTHSTKEKLLRINNELKRHHEKATQMIIPLADKDMKNLVKECQDETRQAPSVSADCLRAAIDETKKILSNFQYNNVENTTATSISPDAHEITSNNVTSKSNVQGSTVSVDVAA